MFATMTGFLWYFFIGLGLIIIGILWEEKLIAFEEMIGQVFHNLCYKRRTHK